MPDSLTAPPLHPYALTTFDNALAGYLRASKGNVENAEWIVTNLINAVTDRLEGNVGRALRVRNYRAAVQVAGTTTNGSASVTGIASTANLKEFDEVTGTGIQDGTLIYNIDSGTAITLSKPATANGSGVTLTCGSAPLLYDFRRDTTVEGYWKLPTGLTPLQQVYGIRWADFNGSLTSLDLTAMRIKPKTGTILLTAAPPYVATYIEVSLCAGVMPPKPGTNRGFDGWSDLENLALRCIQCVYQDWFTQAGRGGNHAPMGMVSTVQSFKWPDDIMDQIKSLRTYW